MSAKRRAGPRSDAEQHKDPMATWSGGPVPTPPRWPWVAALVGGLGAVALAVWRILTR